MAQPELRIDIVTGKNKADETKQWRALKITIGEWSKLIFTNSDKPVISSNFEMDYIEKTVNEANTLK